MKTTIRLFSFGLALFLSVTVALPARAVCQVGCLTNNNTVLGDDALFSVTTGFDNTALGFEALFSVTTGSANTATGWTALQSNTTGFNNTANGSNALARNTTGINNTATGEGALFLNTTGSQNTASGVFALGNNIDGISGSTVPTGVAVIVDASGHLGTTTSSARFKEAIKPMDKASEAILALQPVTFCYRKELDLEGIPQFGLVAEDVEKVNPDLVARDERGKPYTVRYEAVNAMLLNEFLKDHRAVEEQEATISELKSTVAQQQKGMEVFAATLKEQASQIQKVSAELEVSKPAPQTALNNQ